MRPAGVPHVVALHCSGGMEREWLQARRRVCARHGVCLGEPGRASDAVQKGAVGNVPHAKCVVEGRNELHRPKPIHISPVRRRSSRELLATARKRDGMGAQR